MRISNSMARLGFAAALLGATALSATPAPAQTTVTGSVSVGTATVVTADSFSGAGADFVLEAAPVLAVTTDQVSPFLNPIIAGVLPAQVVTEQGGSIVLTSAPSSPSGTTITIQGGSITTAGAVMAASPLTVSPGIQSIVPGTDIFVGSIPAPADLRDDQESVAYQINPAHTGAITFDNTFKPPLKVLWNDTAEGAMSYPLIARNKVFIWVSHFLVQGFPSGGRLYALDKRHGTVLWQKDLAATFGEASLAYDAGRIFLATFDGLLVAFDADDGVQEWSTRLATNFLTAPPTAADGTVFVSVPSELFALDETNGALRWSQSILGDSSSPALSGEGVFATFPCQVYAFNPVTGEQLWRHNGPCEGGGGKTPVYYRGHLYDTEFIASAFDAPAGHIFDVNTGNAAGSFGNSTFAGILGPAFQGGAGYFAQSDVQNPFLNGTLTAFDVRSGGTIWNFASTSGFGMPPLVVNDTVFAFDLGGTLHALNRVSGEETWTANADPMPVETTGVPVTGMAAGEGILVVPAGRHLYALAPEHRSDDDE